MARFYGWVQGARGEATRQGHSGSGLGVWAQTSRSRITVNYGTTYGDPDRNEARIILGAGWTSGYRSFGVTIHPDEIIKALDSGDPQCSRIWQRIVAEFERLDEEAPKAILRNERRQERQRRADERERQQIKKMRDTIVRELTGREMVRLTHVIDADWDSEGGLKDHDHVVERCNLRYAEDGKTVIVTTRPKGAFQLYDFDVTNGIWLLPFSPEDLNIGGPIHDTGYGYKIHIEVEA